MDAGVHARVMALANPGSRAEAALALARELGAEELALLVRDAGVGAMVPAPGMPKTIAGGPLWKDFLRQCCVDGVHAGVVDMPPSRQRPAMVLVHQGVAAVLLGFDGPQSRLEDLRASLPLLGALLRAEHQWVIGQAQIREARQAADRAHTLVKALDAARGSAASLNEQLRREHAQKDEFLAMLAHELRNPLAPLVTSVAILKRVERPEPRLLGRQVDVMARQLDQLTHLVDDLLDVSRVSRGLIELRREHLLLSDVIATAVEAARPALESRRHTLKLLGDMESLYVNGDRVRLTQVFANLLQNAAKYTDPEGEISVGAVRDMGRVSITVRDTGIGIPPDMLSRIFDLFQQVPVALDRSQGGLGIGLTLVRTLAELHGGHVTAHSVGLGHGSTFTVTLPLVQAPQPAQPQPVPQAPPTQARVLVVDDNIDAGDTLEEMLRFLGAEARTARDGPQAIQIAQSFAPDLVLLDIGLPGMNGYEVARRLREQPGLQMRLVALTGYGSVEDRQHSRAAGFDEHLVKPVAPAALEKLLAGLLPAASQA